MRPWFILPIAVPLLVMAAESRAAGPAADSGSPAAADAPAATVAGRETGRVGSDWTLPEACCTSAAGSGGPYEPLVPDLASPEGTGQPTRRDAAWRALADPAAERRFAPSRRRLDSIRIRF